MKVVIIEDDPEIVEAVSLCLDLRWSGVQVLSASEGLSGVELVKKESPDLVILDIGLPDIDGFEVCRRLRISSDVPVVILTVKDQEFDRVRGLELGADDYITKPFSHVELLARVKAVLRRSTVPKLEKTEEPLIIGKIRIDPAAQEVRTGGEEVKLTTTEYNLLYLLAKNAGRAMPYRVLLEKVWGSEYVDATDYLKVYIQRLRLKLGDDPKEPGLILSEDRVGYKLAKQS
jgi:DNA-binding response OmpR family regulator